MIGLAVRVSFNLVTELIPVLVVVAGLGVLLGAATSNFLKRVGR